MGKQNSLSSFFIAFLLLQYNDILYMYTLYRFAVRF